MLSINVGKTFKVKLLFPEFLRATNFFLLNYLFCSNEVFDYHVNKFQYNKTCSTRLFRIVCNVLVGISIPSCVTLAYASVDVSLIRLGPHERRALETYYGLTFEKSRQSKLIVL
jgi:hypothetical protein